MCKVMDKFNDAVFDVVTEHKKSGDTLVLRESIQTLEEALKDAAEDAIICRELGLFRIHLFANIDEEHYELVCTME